MDFYARQASARRQTRWLLAGFLLAVVLVVIAVDLVVAAAVRQQSDQPVGHAIFVTTLFTLAIITGASIFRTFTLRDGGGAVARGLGGTRVDRGSSDPAHQRLLNVVEEMTIASGVPMPEVYVLENESGINAFAAGHTPANAAVAVTQGALQRLSRDELQGVIAHEFSHVLNGDMALNIRLMGWLFGLLAIAVIGRTVLRHSSGGGDSRRGHGGILVLAFAIMAIGYIGLFFGRVLQAAVSRKREQLADASAVQFTRNPQGLKGALVKIGGLGDGSRLVTADGEEVAHMLFATGQVRRLLATHPPLIERIQALDPSFKVTDFERTAALAQREYLGVSAATSDAGLPASGLHGDVSAEPRRIADQVGKPETVHVRHAAELRADVPAAVAAAATSPELALPMLLASLFGAQPEVAARQREIVVQSFGSAVLPAIDSCRATLRTVSDQLRLPILQLLFPTLRRLTLADRRRLFRTVNLLARIDGQTDVFECALALMLGSALNDELIGTRRFTTRTTAQLTAPVAVVFSVLATHGTASETAARRSYEAGLGVVLPRERPPYQIIGNWPQQFANALQALQSLHPYGKRALVEGLVKTIAHDERLSTAEAELLRTVCAVLRCPLPPLLPRLESARLDADSVAQ
ncbi:MAG TPA: M48 family metallopeptidase [Steroidobacteraceae bacterium]|nr:M48 family metallopeptidase [Steroidobacteraceae bacterium]HRX88190.1 M48 family metallopeptidase [Steroidobacteraceae bacterium]